MINRSGHENNLYYDLLSAFISLWVGWSVRLPALVVDLIAAFASAQLVHD